MNIAVLLGHSGLLSMDEGQNCTEKYLPKLSH